MGSLFVIFLIVLIFVIDHAVILRKREVIPSLEGVIAIDDGRRGVGDGWVFCGEFFGEVADVHRGPDDWLPQGLDPSLEDSVPIDCGEE
jgi:hypothetical protein